MKYIIVGYTSNIDIKTSAAKVRYVSEDFYWVDNIKDARYFDTRDQANEFIESYNLQHTVSYGIED